MDIATAITGKITGRLDPILELVAAEPGLALSDFADRLGYSRGAKHELGFVVQDPMEESGINAAVQYGWVVLSHDGKLYLGRRHA